MPRFLLLLLLLSPFAVLFAVVGIASNILDVRGVPVPGTVFTKREYVSVRYSHWEITRTMTVQYPLLETGGYYFADFPLPEDRYDSYRKGQTVALHYLRKRDLPALPLFPTLWEMHVLPRIRLADQTTASALRQRLTPGMINGLKLAAVVVLLLAIWRTLRIPYFAWSVGLCVLGAVLLTLRRDFPMPVPPPSGATQQASARIARLERISKLFAGVHEAGLVADQPVDVVAAEFIPAGRSEPVVAVDLIDAGSSGLLTENQTVVVDYQENAPRVAWLRRATRHFPERNLRGIAVQGLLCLIVLIGCVAASLGVGQVYRWLTGRNKHPA